MSRRESTGSLQLSNSMVGDVESRDYQSSKQYYNMSEETYQVVNGNDSSCRGCGKRVYEMEKIIADQVLYHKSCFKCMYCKRLLNLGTYSSMEGTPYCKPHFIEIFKSKGQYEVYTGEDRLAPRIEEDSEPPSTPPPLPAVRNMKGLFETQGQSTVVPSPKSAGYSKVIACQSSSSKWDKTSEPRPQTPVNCVTEDNPTDEEVLPPPDITRNLVAKFRSIQQGAAVAAEDSPTNRKPVRQFTPPRESPERQSRGFSNVENDEERLENREDVVRAVDKGETEEELPPPCITKNLVAMFKSMVVEDDTTSESVRRSFTSLPSGSDALRSSNFMDECTDGGVFENEPALPVDVVRETDPTDEQELPEAGITRSLVAQWKWKEQTVSRSGQQSPSNESRSTSVSGGGGGSVPRPRSTVKVAVRSNTGTNGQLGMDEGVSAEGGGGGSSQVTEEVEEEALPPADITKNLLAKFQTIEAELQVSTNLSPAKKQFKWDVKEVKPINYPGLVKVVEKNPDDENFISRTTDDTSDEEEGERMAQGEQGGELPHPAFTKIMLDKFRSMEKS